MRALHLTAALGIALASSFAHAQATPAGLWKTIDDAGNTETSLIRIIEAGGVFSGRLEKLLEPGARQDSVCDKCTDERKDKPIVGMVIIKGVKQSESNTARFDGGEILDPNNGKTYKLSLTPIDAGKKLTVRGYIGTPLLGRTQTWIRAE